MAIGKDSGSPNRKWYVIIIFLVVLAAVLLAIAGGASWSQRIVSVVWLLAAAVGLIALVVLLAKVIGLAKLIETSTAKLERISEAQDKSRAVLEQIVRNLQLSESAKGIVFRDADATAIKEAVFDKLQSQDFAGAEVLIDELSASGQYKTLAEQLRKQVRNFQTSGDQERQNQLIANIDGLLDEYEWAKASVQIENLIRAFPDSERARQMRQKLIDKKDERKKVLLKLWDEAVRRQSTDQSLQILRELDMYLTPNEGLALQEAARDVFRTKLHNMGVQFSLAVSGRQWDKALEAGQQIIRDFPNSRMAEEIRERLDVLRQRVQGAAK
jgi:predicted DNA-binding WGR domain protein/uncharacterized membrane protein YciS (DUF1049 family)